MNEKNNLMLSRTLTNTMLILNLTANLKRIQKEKNWSLDSIVRVIFLCSVSEISKVI